MVVIMIMTHRTIATSSVIVDVHTIGWLEVQRGGLGRTKSLNGLD